MKVWFFGDPHFSSKNSWTIEVVDKIINWVENLPPENDRRVAFILGDLVDQAVNGGLVTAQVERFTNGLLKTFEHVIVLRGNHDYKYYHKVEQLGYEYLKHKENVTIIESATILNIEGISIGCLPHYMYNKDHPSMTKYYEDTLPSIREWQNLDVIAGHFGEKGTLGFGNGLDLSKFNAKNIILGDIHTIVGPNYTGSLYPCKTSENDTNRKIFIIDSKTKLREERTTPEFLRYEFLDFNSDDVCILEDKTILVYTIKNCNSEESARAKYGNLKHIKACIPEIKMNLSNDYLSPTSKLAIDVVLNEWIKQRDKPLSRGVMMELKSILST